MLFHIIGFDISWFGLVDIAIIGLLYFTVWSPKLNVRGYLNICASLLTKNEFFLWQTIHLSGRKFLPVACILSSNFELTKMLLTFKTL